MPELVINQIERLTPFWDRIVRRPLSVEEIRGIEHGVGLPMPFGLQALLRRVGLFQDLFPHLFQTTDDFIQTSDFLKGLPGHEGAELFPFATDGAGNYYCLALGDPAEQIVMVDHDCAFMRELDICLGDWVRDQVERALATVEERVCNSRKHWHVQFTFATAEAEPIIRALERSGLRKKDGAWEPVETSPSGVRRFIMALSLGRESVILNRLEHGFWDTPVYSLDIREPVATAMGNSRIRRLRQLFEMADVGCKLISYGPLVEDQVA
ncbi:MAG: SMI1/KNR4 family protein [Acidobacteriota bacterium]|nr:SMI1/KNR4 family protein [Acidobacteriota bacterium]